MDTKLGHRIILLAGLTLAVSLATARPTVADVITVSAGDLSLFAGHNVSLGEGASVTGIIAAGNDITLGEKSSVQGLYALDDIQVKKETTVRGRVLANDKADADQDLDFQGVSWTGKSVHLKKSASVLGDVTARDGKLEIDRDAGITGNLWGSKGIDIDKDSTVQGNATPGAGYGVSVGHNVTITGSTDPGLVEGDTFDLPDLPVTPSRDAYGSQNIKGNKEITTQLDAGAYRDVEYDDRTTLTLSAGVYDLKSFDIDKDSTVYVDTSGGDVVINAGTFEADEGVTFEITGQGDFIINTYDTNGVWLGDDCILEAQVNAYGGKFQAGQDVDFTGFITAGEDIKFDKRAKVQMSRTRQHAPEPGTLILLTIGAAFVTQRKRRSRKLARN